MPQAPTGKLLRHVRQLLAAQEDQESSDQELLRRFVAGRDEAAFAALVQRYGPLVLGVCRRVLGHAQDAEDAFQATFLVLARRAGSIRKQDALGSWLHGVAHRVAAKARTAAARRRAGERKLQERPCTEPVDALTWGELRTVLDEELRRLPEKYRAPLVLCYLDGKTQDEAARQLGWTPGAVKGRLERGRLRLRGRLARRGVTLSAALLAAALAEQAARAAIVPALLAGVTTRAAMTFAAGTEAAAAGVSAQAAALAETGLKAVTASQAKIGPVLLLTAVAAATGAAALARQVPAARSPETLQDAAPTAASPRASREQSPDSVQRRTDRYGDPLPAGAVARLGTLRLRHGGGAAFVRFTPDGKLLVTQGADGVRTWEVATGRQISFLPTGKGARWEAAALAPDGKRLALAGETGIHLWEIPAGRPIATFDRHPYVSICFSPDGQLLAALRADQPDRVELLEATTGREIWSWSAGRQGKALLLAFAADGKAVIAVGWNTIEIPPLKDNAVHFLDVATGNERRQINLGTNSPQKVSLSPDGSLLAVVSRSPGEHDFDDHISVWNVADGTERFRLKSTVKAGSGRQKVFWSLTFTRDSKSLVTAGGEDGLVVWDMATGKARRQLGRDMTLASDLAVAPDGKSMAVTHIAGWVRLIDWESGRDLLPITGLLASLNQAAITPDGHTVVTIDPYALRLWDPTSGREKAWREGDRHGISNNWPTLTPDGRTAFFSKREEKAYIGYDVATGKERSRVSLAFAGKQPGVYAVAPGGDLLAVATWQDDAVHLVDSATGGILRTLRDPGHTVVRAVFTAGGRTLAVFRDNYTVQIWDATTGAVRRHVKLPDFRPPAPNAPATPSGPPPSYQVALSPDGKRGAYVNPGELIIAFDTATGQELYRLPTLSEGFVMPLVFSDDGRTLGWGGFHGSRIHLVEVATGKERLTLAGHRGGVRCLCFSADGRMLVSGGDDTTGLVWDLTGQAARGKPLTPADLGACWAALAADDAARAYQAEWQLVASPAQAVPYLAARLHRAGPVDEKRVDGWITDLNSDQFSVRAHASQELEKLGPAAAPACRAALRTAPSAEARHRLEELLDRQAQELRTPSGENLRALRAVEVLERVGTPSAREILGRLAGGVPDARLTQEAKAALQRLTKPVAGAPG